MYSSLFSKFWVPCVMAAILWTFSSPHSVDRWTCRCLHTPQPMAYGEAQYYLRRFLTLPWKTSFQVNHEAAGCYTLHGLKATLTSWALQLDVPEEFRRLHAKHRGPQQSATLYSRDDVSGALKLQQTIVDQVRSGWKPCTPRTRKDRSQFKSCRR